MTGDVLEIVAGVAVVIAPVLGIRRGLRASSRRVRGYALTPALVVLAAMLALAHLTPPVRDWSDHLRREPLPLAAHHEPRESRQSTAHAHPSTHARTRLAHLVTAHQHTQQHVTHGHQPAGGR